jgi:pimeloyl-ACP methyl ester carboxylesterase
VWLAGFGTGGGLCISAAAARRPSVAGVAVLGAPADFSDWANHPRRLLQHAREVGAITDPPSRRTRTQWTRQLREIKPGGRRRPTGAATPADPARLRRRVGAVVRRPGAGDAHGHAELRIVSGAATTCATTRGPSRSSSGGSTASATAPESVRARHAGLT